MNLEYKRRKKMKTINKKGKSKIKNKFKLTIKLEK